MKKTILPLALTLFMAGTIFVGCESPAQKVDNAQQNVIDAQAKVVDAQNKLDQSQIDSAAEYEKTKVEWASKIATNQNTLTEYKIKISKEKKEQKTKDEKRLTDLEKRNQDLKATMNDFKQDGKDTWADFKFSFNTKCDEFAKDMDGFGQSLADIGKK